MNILVIDPGLGTTGYGIISNVNNDMQLVDFGTIKTSPKEQISKAVQMLQEEYGTASNIKSRVNRLSVLSAIVSTKERLKLYLIIGNRMTDLIR